MSANSFITYTMRALFQRGWIGYEDGIWQTAVPQKEQIWQQQGTAVLRLLTTQNRLYLQSAKGTHLDFARTGMDIDQDLVPVAGCGFLSDFACFSILINKTFSLHRSHIWRIKKRQNFYPSLYTLKLYQPS